MKRVLLTLLRRSAHSKALLFLLLSVGFLAMPQKAAAQQDLADDFTVDVSGFCDEGFFCELESVTIIFDTTSSTHLDVLSETDVNLDAQDDGFGAYNCATVLQDGNDIADGCGSDDGSGTASLSASIPIDTTHGTSDFTLVNDTFLADLFSDPSACDDGDPTFCFSISEDALDLITGPISINAVSPLFVTVGTSGTLTITGENLVNPFGGPQPDVQAHLPSGAGSGFTVSSPNFSPDGSGGTVSYEAAQNATVGKWKLGISYTMGDGFKISTNEGSLTVGYPPASVTNVDPQPWLAGQSNLKVTITGQNFGPNPTLTISGTGVTLINFTPNPNGQSIVANVSVDLNAPNGSAFIDVTPGYNGPFVCACAGSPDGTSSVNVQAAVPPPPQIIFNGSNVAGSTKTVAAGQRIALTGIPPAGFSVASASWSSLNPSGMVGGYGNGSGGPPDPTGGHVVPTPSMTCPTVGNCNFTFYYSGAPGTDTLTLTYVLNNGLTSSASVVFNTTGPSGNILPTVALQPDNRSVVITNATNASATMSFGNAPGAPNAGAVITSNVTVTTGKLIWVQIKQFSMFTQIFDPTSGFNPQANTGVGLDGGFPYPPRSNNSASDAPSRSLFSFMGRGSFAFDAIMYAMWDAAIPAPGQTCTPAHVNTATTPYTFVPSAGCDSIPVPLGFVEYKWSGCSINNGAGAHPNWSVECGAAKSLPPGPSGFPEWSACIKSFFGGCQ